MGRLPQRPVRLPALGDPENIRRKDELTAAIQAAPAEPDAGTAAWLDRLHALVDELDALEPAFTGYDRFGSAA